MEGRPGRRRIQRIRTSPGVGRRRVDITDLWQFLIVVRFMLLAPGWRAGVSFR